MCRSYFASTYSSTVQYCPDTATTLAREDNCAKVLFDQSEEPGKVFPGGLALHLDLAETAMCVANFQNAGERRWKVLFKDLV